MKKLLLLALSISMFNINAQSLEPSTISFDAVNIIIGTVRNKLPEGCSIIKQDPKIVSRSPVKVMYKFTLKKGSESASIEFEQSQSDFKYSTDEKTYETIQSADDHFELSANSDGEVTKIKVNNLVCSK